MFFICCIEHLIKIIKISKTQQNSYKACYVQLYKHMSLIFKLLSVTEIYFKHFIAVTVGQFKINTSLLIINLLEVME